jgi:hypothetical protein
MKIFGKVPPGSVHYRPANPNEAITGRLPPYREDGGIQLYQSLHRHLSEGQRMEPNLDVRFDPTSLDPLDTEIGGGFPKGRCTALVGERGGLKSHFAYLWLLSATSDAHDEPALLLSLRDDEAEALSRLDAIHKTESRGGARTLQSPRELIANGRLRIVHYRPGYIAPDEFLFRLWFHVHDFRPKRVVIASLEQLDALFPLCSVEPVFVPSLLDVLAAHHITTVAIGVSGENQPTTQYGLLPQSSLILSFHLDPKAALGHVRLGIRRLPTARPSGGGGTIFLDGSNRLRFSPSRMDESLRPHRGW